LHYLLTTQAEERTMIDLVLTLVIAALTLKAVKAVWRDE
jgi:hypothetical protein